MLILLKGTSKIQGFVDVVNDYGLHDTRNEGDLFTCQRDEIRED